VIFQIDVENPCVIMSQDKSREFLHSGNDKDKFKVIKFIRFLAIPSHMLSLFIIFYFIYAMELLCPNSYASQGSIMLMQIHVPLSALYIVNFYSC